ncbi:MAG: hypothetical protein ACI4TN_00400 [Candidatus Enterosoma sp.]|nr:hypothetical protein [Bacilli bacterium]
MVIRRHPLCIRSKDTEEIIRTIKFFAGSWGGINLEDISAPAVSRSREG